MIYLNRVIYGDTAAYRTLYELLKERDDTVNVEATSLPTYEQHVTHCNWFLSGYNWGHWSLIQSDGEIVGAVSCTAKNELGIFIFKKHQGRGYGPKAVLMMIEEIRRERDALEHMPVTGGANRCSFKAKINAKNKKSQSMFEGLGFVPQHITYELPA